MKKPFLTYLYSTLAAVLLVPCAMAEKSATFTLYTPRYYQDGFLISDDPEFISGTRGTFVSTETFSAQSQFVCNSDMPSGYCVSKWVLYKAFTSTVVAQQTGGSSYTVVFDYKWASKYGNGSSAQFDLVVYLEPLSYTLSYNANGGDWTAGEPEGGTYAGNDAVTAPGADAVERDNFSLSGWKSSTGAVVAPGETFTGMALGVTSKGQKVTMYAQWGKVTYKVTLNKEGGKVVKGSDVTSYEYGVGATLPTLEKKNYIFEGWYDNPQYAGAVVTAISKTDSGNKEFWAKFGDGVFDVTLVKNGGTCKDLTSYTYGVGATLPKATKANCSFDGWYDNPNFQGDPVTKIGKDETGDKTFYAKFTQDDTVVHYNGNGATSGTMSDSAFVYGTPMALAKNAFARSYTVTYDANGGTVAKKSEKATFAFRNWNSQPDGQGKYTYGDQQDVTNPCGSTGEAVTLYALWNDEKVTVALPTPTRAGYEFSGWFTAESGGIRVGGAGTAYEPSHDITLYAHWGNENAYTIHFSPNADATGSMADRVLNVGETISLPDCAFQNPASDKGFLHWEYGGKQYNKGGNFPDRDAYAGELMVLKAVWGESCGALSDHIGLKNAKLETSCEGSGTNWIATVDGNKVTCLKLDYTEEGKEGCSILSMKVVGPGRVSFCMHGQSEDTVTVVEGAHQQSYTVVTGQKFGKAETFVVNTLGEVDVQWRVDVDNDVIYMKDITWTPTGKRTLATSVCPNKAGTVDGGGEYATDLSATLTATENKNYKFVRWSDGETDNPYPVKVTCNETYQAIFSKVGGEPAVTSNYYILFDGNGAGNLGAMDAEQQMTCDGEKEKLAANKFTRSGFKFKGWATKRNVGATYVDGQEVNLSSVANDTVKLYAVWEATSEPPPEPEPEPGKTAVTVTITGTTKTVKYTGKEQYVTGYSFASNVKAYKQSYVNFLGEAYASGTAIGTYPMGLSASDFENDNDEYSVTFVVNDGKLVITKDDPGPTGDAGVDIDFGEAATGGDSASVGVGTAVSWTVTPRTSGAKVTVSSLPTGLRYSSKTGLITGTPTKAKTYTTKVKTVVNKQTTTQVFYITVEALPALLVGTYYGMAEVEDGTAGQFQLKLAATGKATGYFQASGKKISLKSTSLAEAGGGYVATASYTYDKRKCTDEILLQRAATVEGTDVWSASVAAASDVLAKVDARRDTIKEVFGKVVPKTTTYRDILDDVGEGEYLDAKVTTAGAVTVSGKLLTDAGKLVSVSCSTHLVVDDAGAAYCWVTIYKAVSKSEPIVRCFTWYLPED